MASSKSRVQILTRKLIKPSNPTPPHLRRHKLSLFDQLPFPVYVHVVFYYTAEGGGDRRKPAERYDLLLEKSLSKVLNKFYPLAGRFVKDEFLIDCSDQGVEFFVAQVNGNDNLLEFLQQGFQMEISKDLLPWEDFPPAADLVTSPLLAIQINTFECGGIALGMQISHTVADAFSLLTFVSEWASTCREAGNGNGNGAEILSPIMYHNFSSLFPARTHDYHHLKLRRDATAAAAAKEEDASSATRIVLGNFLFEGSRISKVKEEIRANGASLFLNPNPSRLVIVIAVIWKALMSVSMSKHGQMKDSVLNLIMSLRGKAGVSPPVEEFLTFGNFWTPLSVTFEAKDNKVKKMEDLHHELVSLIENAIENARKKFVSARTDEILYLLNYYTEEAEKCGKERRDVDIHIVSSWCRFPMYEADFGWGKPYWVSHATRKYEGICLMDAKDGAGIEAWISLEEKEMVEFRRILYNIF